jgi:hypothetical protein
MSIKFVCFVIFVILFFLELFIIKREKRKKLLLFGIGAIAIPIILTVIYAIVMFVFKISGKIEIVLNLDLYFIPLTISSVTFCVLILADLLPPFFIDVILGFHQRFNSDNMDKHPIKFVVHNKLKIQTVFSSILFISSILVFYAIWFELKI